MRGIAALAGVLVGALGLVSTADAATFAVTRTDDPATGTCVAGNCSLRQAVAAANAHSGADTVTLPPGTYTLGQPELTSNQPLMLIGSGAGSTVITGGHQSGPATFGRAGVIDSGANLAIVRLTLSGNSATTNDPTTQTITVGAGAILQTGGTLSLVDSVVSGNQLLAKVTSGAGGVMVNIGVLSMANSTISGNTATLGGTTIAGGAQVNAAAAGSVSTLDSSTFVGNSIGTATVTTGAGAVLFNLADARVVNSTLTGNSAGPASTAGSAGGLYTNIADITLTNSTLAANSATGGAQVGNLQVGGSGTHTLRNTIISDGLGGASSGNCNGTFSSDGGNIESTNQCGLNPSLGDQPNTNPQLGPLVDNGGPTQTRAIAPGTPAFNAAVGAFCPAVDQRGVARPQGAGCDVGAFEFGPPASVSGPAITGTARVGSTLACGAGSWRGSPTFAFAWLRNSAPITGAASASYRLSTADANKAIQCRVTATNAVGSVVAVSQPTGIAPLPLPVNTKRPSISGTLRSGKTVKCSRGRWSGSPTFRFAWLRDGSAIRRATKTSYKIVSRDVGHALQCQVTAHNAGGSVVAFSNPRVPAKAKPKPKRRHR